MCCSPRPATTVSSVATTTRLGGGRGNDKLFGREGRGRLGGGRGSDGLFGDLDADELRGGRGDDRVFGDENSDLVLGGPGRDKLFGGPGRDLIDSFDGERDSVLCGPGSDRVRADRDRPPYLLREEAEPVARARPRIGPPPGEQGSPARYMEGSPARCKRVALPTDLRGFQSDDRGVHRLASLL